VSQPHKPSADRVRSHASVSPIPSWDLKAAKGQIMSWVRTEDIPKNEWERLKSADPNDPKHNLHAVYAVNYALKMAGAIPGKTYRAQESARISERALWILTKDLRQVDRSTSQSLFLRDAQRYLYGTLGEAWLRKYVHDKFHVPEVVAKHASGQTIDESYEKGYKRAKMIGNAIAESVTGKNPGWGRGKADLPNSRPGGEAWYNLGLTRFKEMHPEKGPPKAGNPLLIAPGSRPLPAFAR
jgi:hypothetical protein